MTLQHKNILWFWDLQNSSFKQSNPTPPCSHRSASICTVCTSTHTQHVTAKTSYLKGLVSQNLEFIFPSIAPKEKPEE